MMNTSRILLTVAVLALVGCGKEKGHWSGHGRLGRSLAGVRKALGA
jgi:hypothetical protein